MDVLAYLKDNILVFDGAMGTMLQKSGLAPGELPEMLNLTNPEVVTSIHRAYVEAGSDVITANTFQAHELKLDDVEAVVSAGIRCARASGARYVALDVGPLGQLMAPMGTLSFERAYEIFRRQMIAGEKAGADLILIETLSDLYEAKAAILAARESTALPVFCTMTFQADGRTFVGCDPLTAAVTLEGLGVDALGVNCSLGPELLRPAVDIMLERARVPVMVQANAGLPVMADGESRYDISPEQYAAGVCAMVRRGVRIIGGCCGTTPDYIRAMLAQLAGKTPVRTAPVRLTACTSGTRTVVLDGVTTEIGERLNPTGKKKMQAALREGNIDYLVGEALSQVEAGATVLDVNVGLPELDEPRVLAGVIAAVQGITPVPLTIDSADPAAIEAGVRAYNGKPIINSVNGKAEVMAKIFPIAKKYGALVIGLTLDERGIPETAAGRLDIARRILGTARSHGIADEDLIIDCLVLTASAQQEQVKETLEAVRLVKSELHLKTSLGVSNVSFGLPGRDLLGATFLAAALGAGLDAAILNPLSPRYREVLDAYRVLSGEDRRAAHYIEARAQDVKAAPAPRETTLTLRESIEQGRREQALAATMRLLETENPLTIIDREFIPALNAVGKRFEQGELFLPQLLQSAQAVQAGFALIKERMSAAGQSRSKGKVLLATVQGDIHDIGKNIVRMLLENYGYEVVDLGKDVPIESVVDAIREQDIRLAGLSALMTTTVGSMKDTIAAVRAAHLPCTFFVGGAVMSEEYARFVGADFYARDAMEGVNYANRFFG